MKISIFRNYKFYLSVFAVVCLSGILWIQLARASDILQIDSSQSSQLPSWTSRVNLIQAIDLSSIASSTSILFTFKANYSALPLFDIGLGGFSDISGMDGVTLTTSTSAGKIIINLEITSSTLINTIANNTNAIKFFVCNDAPACASNVIYGTATDSGFSNPQWTNNIDVNTGDDTNLKAIYMMVWTSQTANEVSTSGLNWNFSYGTTTPGFISNATTTQDWLTSIWDSTSTSGFSIDCSGYSGGLFSSSTMGAIGCYAQKIPMGIAGMLITPMPFATNYISESFQKIQNVFPFSLVFGLRNELQTTIENTDTATSSVLSIPIYGHGSFDVLGPTTLQDIVGVELKDKIFTVIKSIIWLSTGVGLFLLI